MSDLVGKRVRLRGEPIQVTLNGDTGVVIRPAPGMDGYVIVRLDRPATYHDVDLGDIPLSSILEADDNLEVLA